MNIIDNLHEVILLSVLKTLCSCVFFFFYDFSYNDYVF
jgi:hypothetical protein